jgi:hypothetical protein
VNGFGFWGGKNETDACAYLTNVPADVWSSQPLLRAECSQLLQRRFQSFLISVSVVIYYWILSKALQFLFFRAALVNALRSELVSLSRVPTTDAKVSLKS